MPGKAGQVVVDGRLVGDDVDQRIKHTNLPRPGSGQEHRQQGIETALCTTAVDQAGVHSVPPLGDTDIPIVAELAVTEPVEDRLDHHSSRDTTVSVHEDALIDHTDMSVTTGMGAFVRAVCAVGVSESLPTADNDSELVEPQLLTVCDQQTRRVGELGGTARVGEHPSQQSGLATPGRPACAATRTTEEACNNRAHCTIVFDSGPDQLQIAFTHPETDACPSCAYATVRSATATASTINASTRRRV